MKSLRTLFAAALLLTLSAPAWAWGRTGHRLVAEVAWDHLTPQAKAQVQALLGKESLGDVASWADGYLSGNRQTAFWHYVNIPPSLTYNRDRDCQTQPGVTLGSHADKWRDCVVDRIPYNLERINDPSLDTADRAVALKFLVHLVGDEHQPFHAYGLGRGANDIPVTFFGEEKSKWGHHELHEVWDDGLIDHAHHTDAEWLKRLEQQITDKHLEPGDGDSVAWAQESHDLADTALVLPGTNIDEAYYDKNIPIVETRLELAGIRLAKLLNTAFATSAAH
ncbi:MAG: S1/P1 nuclease [Acidobacteriaceae bacterium]|nr:S1/P1 nuclease [Acidobacteriaceae bacterium]